MYDSARGAFLSAVRLVKFDYVRNGGVYTKRAKVFEYAACFLARCEHGYHVGRGRNHEAEGIV